MMNIIAIDGPVGAGKSTVARALAKRLGYAYLDTGAMDMGTVVFPDAMYKFYLDADIAERGKRRWKELSDKGMEVELTETIRNIEERDANDKGRSIAPLRKAGDAALIDTTGLGLDEVVDRICMMIKTTKVRN